MRNIRGNVTGRGDASWGFWEESSLVFSTGHHPEIEFSGARVAIKPYRFVFIVKYV